MMQKMVSKFLPFILLLFLFSCAKDNDLVPPEQVFQEDVLQAKAKPCEVPCRKPDWINIGKVGSCSAAFSWGYSKKICGTFMVRLYNHTTEEWTTYNSATSPLILTGLNPCTQYTVGVSHITDKCASILSEISFQTDCKPCKPSCDIPCEPLDYFTVDHLSTTGATINFGHTPSLCGSFTVHLKNNDTEVTTYHHFVTSPWELTGLEPCTSYTIGVSHVTNLSACLSVKKHFTTECSEPPCDIEVLSELSVITDQLGFSVPGLIGFNDNDFQCNELGELGVLCPSATYMNITEPVLRLEPGMDFTALFCYSLIPVGTVGDVDINIWVDFNDDGTFSANELIIDFSFGGNTAFCVSGWEPENIPTEGICQVPARYIISIDAEIVSPCEDIQSGQVIDFLVDIGDCNTAP